MSMSSHALLFQVLLLHNRIVWATDVESVCLQENSEIRRFFHCVPPSNAAALCRLPFDGRVSQRRGGGAGAQVR